MIPTRTQCLALFDKFSLPSQKKIHVEEVTKLALYLARKILAKQDQAAPDKINLELLEAAGLLHDIDKNITKRAGERHPDTAVRVLKELGMDEVADVVRKHSLHCILNSDLTPQNWEEKLLFLADKLVKYEVIGVAHRFKLWYKENLPMQAVAELDAALPKVKALEQEVYQAAGITYDELVKEFSA
jgi:putative nucleotidyltransferase with HDIG domain